MELAITLAIHSMLSYELGFAPGPRRVDSLFGFGAVRREEEAGKDRIRPRRIW